ncbi:MAG: GAF and ANTAR domain-containing protein [Burkholderiaceae bacterium]|nr:GAF and ANTAR domain-containing protein [Microbacteriaceae bacterium]
MPTTTGASVSVLASRNSQSTICASDEVAARLDELQFDLGVGPCWQSLSTRQPVIAPRLRTDEYSAWPIFTQALHNENDQLNVAAIFAFPLVVGSLDIGAVDLYSVTEGSPSAAQITGAMELAGVTAWEVLRRILADGDGTDDPIGDMSRREVHQATGMVLAQLGISAQDAALLLRAHAFATARSVREVAGDVVARRIDFSDGGR